MNDQKPNDKKNPVIKSALELAMEKIKNDPLPDDTLNADDQKNQGKKIAALFLGNTSYDLHKELKSSADQNHDLVADGVKEIFLFNIILPRDEKAKNESVRALDGLRILFDNNKNAKAFCKQIASLLDDYLAQRNTYYVQLKQQFQAQASVLKAQVESQMGQGVRVDPEHLPEFQEKWKQLISQIDEQYDPALNELKENLVSLT